MSFFREISVLCCLLLVLFAAKDDPKKNCTAENCEVCVSVMRRMLEGIDVTKATVPEIKKYLEDQCNNHIKHPRDIRLCNYAGCHKDSPTAGSLKVAQELKKGKPAEKVCQALVKTDSQICDIKYDKQIDLKTVDIKKLKVKELKKILEENSVSCNGCSEKSEFVKKVTEIAEAQGRPKSEL